MARPFQEVSVFGIQDRRSQAAARKPFLVRWAIDGRQRSKAFRTEPEADRYRAELLIAVTRGEPFDPATGEPVSWSPPAPAVSVFAWARRWIAEQWPEWQPRTRRSARESIARFVVLAVDENAPPPPPGCRAAIARALAPDCPDPMDGAAQRWIERWSLPLDGLSQVRLSDIERGLGLGDSGQLLAAQTAGRHRKNGRACVRRAVELGLLANDPWPPSPRGRSRRKAARLRRRIDARRLPDPDTMARAIAAIPTHQPGSHKYRIMTAVIYYAGLRPSEVVMLRPRALDLPADGWGVIDVREADIDFDEPGEPKTGPRMVPIPPILVALLREWVDEHGFAASDLIFRTRTDRRPSHSNWSRAWHRALRKVGVEPLRVYDCRHAAATTWLKAGVPLGEVAQRLGHSVDTLVSTYVGALTGDDALANHRIDEALRGVALPLPSPSASRAGPYQLEMPPEDGAA
jgi:integrase